MCNASSLPWEPVGEGSSGDRSPAKRGYSFSHSKQSSLERRHEYCFSSFKKTGSSSPAQHFYSQITKEVAGSEDLAVVPVCLRGWPLCPHVTRHLIWSRLLTRRVRCWGDGARIKRKEATNQLGWKALPFIHVRLSTGSYIQTTVL